jgi:hypothetical protein
MVDVVTYSSENANPKEKWMAYIVLPNGELWLVRFTGETEQIAKDKAIRLYEAERAKVRATEPSEVKADGFSSNTAWPKPSSGHHLAGKRWIIHVASREKLRIEEGRAAEMVASGEWNYCGPRAK